MKQCSSGHAWENGEKCDRCGGIDTTAPASVADQTNMNDEKDTLTPAPVEESAPEEVAPAEDVEEEEEEEEEESVESEESESSDEADSAPAPALA